MPDKRINLNFFQLNPVDEHADPVVSAGQINQIETVFANLPAAPNPVILTESKVNILGQVENRNGIVLGTFIRNQTTGIPPSYDEANSAVSPLPLLDGQGLGYQTCFLYDPAVRILMIESTKNAIGMGVLCAFLQKNVNVPTLEASIVINPEKLQEFYDMTAIYKIHFKVAKLENGGVFKTNKNTSLGQVIHSADKTDTDTLEYTLTKTKRKDGASLAISKMKSIVKSLLRFEDTREVKTLVISGRQDDDSPTDTINFIEQRLKDSITVPQVRLIANFNIQDHYNKMEVVYAVHKAALNIYKIKRG